MEGLWLAVARRDDGVGTAACGCPRVVGLAAARTRGRLGSHFAGLEAAACRRPGALAKAAILFFLFFGGLEHSLRGLGSLWRKGEGGSF